MWLLLFHSEWIQFSENLWVIEIIAKYFFSNLIFLHSSAYSSWRKIVYCITCFLLLAFFGPVDDSPGSLHCNFLDHEGSQLSCSWVPVGPVTIVCAFLSSRVNGSSLFCLGNFGASLAISHSEMSHVCTGGFVQESMASGRNFTILSWRVPPSKFIYI